MNKENFDIHVDKIKNRISLQLQKKGDEYAPNKDRLENFKRGGVLLKSTPDLYLLNLVSKHFIALTDFIDQLEQNIDVPLECWTEKTGDIINYMILLEAIIKERKELDI